MGILPSAFVFRWITVCTVATRPGNICVHGRRVEGPQDAPLLGERRGLLSLPWSKDPTYLLGTLGEGLQGHPPAAVSSPWLSPFSLLPSVCPSSA